LGKETDEMLSWNVDAVILALNRTILKGFYRLYEGLELIEPSPLRVFRARGRIFVVMTAVSSTPPNYRNRFSYHSTMESKNERYSLPDV
jgi:hypothetical protein